MTEQAEKAKAQQEANAIEYEVSMAKDGLTGAYLGKANALEEDIQHCFDCGMDAFLAKPIVLAQVKSTLREHLIELTDTFNKSA